MDNNRWLVVVNPNAGIRRAEREWPKIEQTLIKEGFEFDVFQTTQPDDATEIVRREITLGYNKVITVGGDGTFNEVANGIMQQKRIPSYEVTLGMITVGTGNDWGRMYNIPLDPVEAIQVIKRGIPFVQDTIKVKYSSGIKIKERYLVNIAGIGFDAEVALRVNKMKEKGKGGKLSYLITIFKTLLQYKTKKAIIKIDQNTFDFSIFSLNVGVCQYNGGGMKQLPHAVPDDGKLAITIIQKIGKFKALTNVHRLYSGSFIQLPEVNTYSAERVDITSDKNLYLEIDGESLGHTPLEFTVKPSTIRILTNH